MLGVGCVPNRCDSSRGLKRLPLCIKLWTDSKRLGAWQANVAPFVTGPARWRIGGAIALP